MTYLGKINALEHPVSYLIHIRAIIQRMVQMSFLENKLVGYIAFFELTERQITNWLWLTPVLGPEFVYASYAPHIVHITGTDDDGDVRAGTGLVFNSTTILTCAHVVTDMHLDDVQTFQKAQRVVKEVRFHSSIDIGVIEVDGPLTPLVGMSFLDPRLMDTVYVLGYPKIHYTQSAELIMQRGEVVNSWVRTIDHQDLFLYSAITNPGNSGGPLISQSGNVLVS